MKENTPNKRHHHFGSDSTTKAEKLEEVQQAKKKWYKPYMNFLRL